jgi:hypothetical protein
MINYALHRGIHVIVLTYFHLHHTRTVFDRSEAANAVSNPALDIDVYCVSASFVSVLSCV